MRHLLLGLCILFLCPRVPAQCPTGLDVRSNEEVAAFLSRFPECTELPGHLTITGAAVTDISGLSQLRKVDGSVLIEGVNLRQLEGLQNIQTICGDVTVRDCPVLSQVGFDHGSALRSVQGAISLDNLPRTSGISWFENLSILSSGFGSNVVGISSLDALSVRAEVDGSALTIPEQTDNGRDYSGSGSRTEEALTINFRIGSIFFNLSCRARLVLQ